MPSPDDLSSMQLAEPPVLPSPVPQAKLIGIAYDVVMLLCIVLSLLLLALDYLLMGGVGAKVFAWLDWQSALAQYRSAWHPMVLELDQWFTLFLITELFIRWGLAIMQQRYHRWFFFPFVHWYDVLGCIPQFRALRLLRALSIGYRLHSLGYNVVPKVIVKQVIYYYKIILEELSDRIVLHVLDGVKKELNDDGLPMHLLRPTFDAYRPEIAKVIAEVMQSAVSPVLRQHQALIARQVGAAAADALKHSHEIQHLLRRIPLLGGVVDQQLEQLGQNVGQQITYNLLAPFVADTTSTELQHIANVASMAEFDSPALQRLLNGLVLATVDVVKVQVRKQQWKLTSENDQERAV